MQKQKRENVFYRDIKLKTAQFCCKQTPTYCRRKKRLNKRDLATESENLLCSTILSNYLKLARKPFFRCNKAKDSVNL